MADSRETRACYAMGNNGSSWKGQCPFLGEVQGVLSAAHRCGNPKEERRARSDCLPALFCCKLVFAIVGPALYRKSPPAFACKLRPCARLPNPPNDATPVACVYLHLASTLFSPRNIPLHPCRSLALHVVSFPGHAAILPGRVSSLPFALGSLCH